jgi:Carboxypeptidase regulatory-like domain
MDKIRWYELIRSLFFIHVVASLLVFVLPSVASAQGETTSAIVGQVTDPSGAAVSGANVMVINTETGATRSAHTDNDAAAVLRCRPLSGRRWLFLDAHQWLARCAAKVIRTSPVRSLGVFFPSLKTLLMPREPISAPFGVNVPGLPLAGFQLTLIGRIWVIPEV